MVKSTSLERNRLDQVSLLWDYFSEDDICNYNPEFTNFGGMTLKGSVTEISIDDSGLYMVRAALGNIATHENLREMSGGTQKFGYTPPSTFAYDFGGIWSQWYPGAKKTEVRHEFDERRKNATFVQLKEGQEIARAAMMILGVVTTSLGKGFDAEKSRRGVRIMGQRIDGAVLEHEIPLYIKSLEMFDSTV